LIFYHDFEVGDEDSARRFHNRLTSAGHPAVAFTVASHHVENYSEEQRTAPSMYELLLQSLYHVLWVLNLTRASRLWLKRELQARKTPRSNQTGKASPSASTWVLVDRPAESEQVVVRNDASDQIDSNDTIAASGEVNSSGSTSSTPANPTMPTLETVAAPVDPLTNQQARWVLVCVPSDNGCCNPIHVPIPNVMGNTALMEHVRLAYLRRRSALARWFSWTAVKKISFTRVRNHEHIDCIIAYRLPVPSPCRRLQPRTDSFCWGQ
jgi:hypothetical protein